jgi:hypothetical protein
MGVATDAVALGAPTSFAADIDGECRYRDGTVDVGADDR